MLFNNNLKTVFYPCCGLDIDSTLNILGEKSYNFIFCDIKHYNNWGVKQRPNSSVKFLKMDAIEAISKLPKIDILFYRRDGNSEGGSGIEVLGDKYLSALLTKFPTSGGNIITDGSNAFGHRLDQLKLSKVRCGGYNIELSKTQDFSRLGLINFIVSKGGQNV